MCRDRGLRRGPPLPGSTEHAKARGKGIWGCGQWGRVVPAQHSLSFVLEDASAHGHLCGRHSLKLRPPGLYCCLRGSPRHSGPVGLCWGAALGTSQPQSPPKPSGRKVHGLSTPSPFHTQVAPNAQMRRPPRSGQSLTKGWKCLVPGVRSLPMPPRPVCGLASSSCLTVRTRPPA